MLYYITRPFMDNRAEVHTNEPDGPHFTVEELPEGEGALFINEEGNGLYRGMYIHEISNTDPPDSTERIDHLEQALETLLEELI